MGRGGGSGEGGRAAVKKITCFHEMGHHLDCKR